MVRKGSQYLPKGALPIQITIKSGLSDLDLFPVSDTMGRHWEGHPISTPKFTRIPRTLSLDLTPPLISCPSNCLPPMSPACSHLGETFHTTSPAQHDFPFSVWEGLMHSQHSHKNSACVHTFKTITYGLGTDLSILHMLTSLIFTTILKKNEGNDHLHFTVEEIQEQRGCVTCIRTHSQI